MPFQALIGHHRVLTLLTRALARGTLPPALLLAGPNSRDVLNRLTELDVLNEAFPNLSARETGLAHVHALLLRDDLDEAIPAFQLLFARSFGEHVWDAVMEAGEQFGILPFGLNAMNIINQ